MLPANPVVFQRNGDALVSGQDAGGEIAGRAVGRYHSGIDVITFVVADGVRFHRDAFGRFAVDTLSVQLHHNLIGR